MKTVSSLLFIVSLVVAVLFGPVTRSWAWSPALILLGLAVLPVAWSYWRGSCRPPGSGWLTLGLVIFGWFCWRACVSPVAELAQADLLLLAAAAGSFLVARSWEEDQRAESIFRWGLAILLLASAGVTIAQSADPSFGPLIALRSGNQPAGFFAHYNEGANFLIGASFLLAGAALFGPGKAMSRWIWILIVAGGLVAAYLTRSRGGILAGIVGCGVFYVVALAIAKRRKAGWFFPAAILLPFIVLGLAAALYVGWLRTQEARQIEGGIEILMDNNIRPYLYGLAVSVIGLHPLAGGGSRSFSWECFGLWERDVQGWGVARPEYVHNELLQAGTDYGLIGAALLVIFVASISILAVIRLLWADPSKSRFSNADACHLGGLAALAGMLTQSSFSFVFHLLPGAMLLGLSLGRIAHAGTDPEPARSKPLLSRIALSALAVFCALLAIPKGVSGLGIFASLWPVYYWRPQMVNPEEKIAALSNALKHSPQAALYFDRALLHHERSSDPELSPALQEEQKAASLADYDAAAALHPYNPLLAINRANLLSILGRHEQAEAEYVRAIELQGGMEAGFKGHFWFANHLMSKGWAQIDEGSPEAALHTFGLAASHIGKAFDESHGGLLGLEGRQLRISIHEGIGVALEATGDFEKAVLAYEHASSLSRDGSSSNLRAAALLERMARTAWGERRPSEALSLFLEARERLVRAMRSEPDSAKKEEQKDLLGRLDDSIRYLREARIPPLEISPLEKFKE